MKNILITGGCGFIGTSLIASLPASPATDHIRVVDNLTTGSLGDLHQVADVVTVLPGENFPRNPGVFFLRGDIRDADLMQKAAEGVGCIVHLAANTGVGPSVEDPLLDMQCNVIGTFNMLEAARLNKVKKFVFASSGAPAGAVEPPIHEELAAHPVSPYGASKLAGEGYCSAYYRTYGIATVCLRFGNVFGPRSGKKSSLVAKFIRQALAGEECVIFGDGRQTRDFIYIDDLIRAIRLSMEKELGGEIFQIASGREHTVNEVAEMLRALLHVKGVSMTLTHASPRIGDVRRNYADTTKAERMLGWRSLHSLQDGLEKTVTFFIQG